MNEGERHLLSSDTPIACSNEDQFGRDRLAARITAEARTAPPDAGFVIALCGAWGTGKTSIANLAIERPRASGDTKVVRFNPWMFSGAEDLVERFFRELAATLSKEEGKLRAVASRIASYAGAVSGVAGLVPGVGGTASGVLAAAHQVMMAAGEAPTLEQRRKDLVEALAELDDRIVVFLDDLDRLTDEEIRQVVKLVKLVGDLPRITYLLSFDRDRVEQALGSPETAPEVARERGRAYLEKIVQSRHDVPPLRATTAISFFQRQIASALVRRPTGPRDGLGQHARTSA